MSSAGSNLKELQNPQRTVLYQGEAYDMGDDSYELSG